MVSLEHILRHKTALNTKPEIVSRAQFCFESLCGPCWPWTEFWHRVALNSPWGPGSPSTPYLSHGGLEFTLPTTLTLHMQWKLILSLLSEIGHLWSHSSTPGVLHVLELIVKTTVIPRVDLNPMSSNSQPSNQCGPSILELIIRPTSALNWIWCPGCPWTHISTQVALNWYAPTDLEPMYISG
jgi:hypothetical protein